MTEKYTSTFFIFYFLLLQFTHQSAVTLNLLLYHRYVSLHKDKQYYQWQNIGKIELKCLSSREFHAFSGIRFFQEIVPSPSVSCHTEQQIHKRTKRKQVITYKEIFQIHDILSANLKACPVCHSQHTWKS